MNKIMGGTTIGAAFTTAVSTHGDRPFLAVPANDARGYLQSGFEISYSEAGKRIIAVRISVLDVVVPTLDVAQLL